DIGLRIEVLHCNLHLVASKVVVHVADAFICIWIQIKKGHLITIVAIVANQDIIEVHVQGYNLLITISFAEMDQFPGPIDASLLYAQDSHRSQLVLHWPDQSLIIMRTIRTFKAMCMQQPDDAGPSQCSPDVMTVSQYGHIGASQILTDEGMTDTQPP
ncbi:hypothetical protein Taro_021217, partial [Colocasia esculenta]|nr:hypothetical protein [Colocasia esculenta]